ncbi:hypothetical protein Ntsu_60130 [Nocardia sp. IFM 10818]
MVWCLSARAGGVGPVRRFRTISGRHTAAPTSSLRIRDTSAHKGEKARWNRIRADTPLVRASALHDVFRNGKATLDNPLIRSYLS